MEMPQGSDKVQRDADWGGLGTDMIFECSVCMFQILHHNPRGEALDHKKAQPECLNAWERGVGRLCSAGPTSYQHFKWTSQTSNEKKHSYIFVIFIRDPPEHNTPRVKFCRTNFPLHMLNNQRWHQNISQPPCRNNHHDCETRICEKNAKQI